MAHEAAETRNYFTVSRHRYFTYFFTDGSAVGAVATESTMSNNFAPSFAFELDKIRLRLSGAHVSIVDFMVYVSHNLGDHFNHNLISQAMLGKKDVLWRADPNLFLHSGDVIHFSMEYSAANVYGLEISGWAITMPPNAAW